MPFVVDTHALVWHLAGDPKLSVEARSVLESVDNGEDHVFVPCIVFFELLYLTEKGKIPVEFDAFLALITSSRNYRVEPLCIPIIEKARKIPRQVVPDPWDRLIAATSMHLNLPLISRDPFLTGIGLDIVW